MKMIRIIAALAALVILSGTAGCRKHDKADADELLKTIPSSASFVAVANISEILEEAGCKVDDGKVSDTEQLRAAIPKCRKTRNAGSSRCFLTEKAEWNHR